MKFSDGIAHLQRVQAESQSEPPGKFLHVSVLLAGLIQDTALLFDRSVEQLRKHI